MSERGASQRGGSFCDMEYLLVNLGRNQATADRLIQLFLDNAPVLSLRLNEAATQGDLLALKNTLHDIRSSCVLFSGALCVDQARDMEHAVREHLLQLPSDRSVVDWHSMSEPLHECMECMVRELKAYLVNRQG